ATFGISFLMSLFLQYIKDYNPQEAGTILVAQPIMMAIFSPVAGRLSDKLGPRYVASTGMAITGAGLLIFSFIDKSTSLSFIIINLLMIGFGYAFFSSPNTNAIMSSVTKKYFGVASATMATMRLTGQTLSMGLIMLVFSTMIGKVEITPAYYPQFLISVRTAFAIFAALSAGGIISSMVRGKIRA
ncbi:MAG: MFS transporter, partial [Bacteroidales bacterium]|nr:MFS transporter [Bacteroidales bacterium]